MTPVAWHGRVREERATNYGKPKASNPFGKALKTESGLGDMIIFNTNV